MAFLKSRPIFSNFRKMVSILRKEITIDPEGIHSAKNIKHIKDILSCMNFNPKLVFLHSLSNFIKLILI